MTYQPAPIDTSRVELSEGTRKLVEQLAKNNHEVWSRQRISEGWRFGPNRDDAKKEHPCLVPYEDLPESEKEYDRVTAVEVLKTILALGGRVEAP